MSYGNFLMKSRQVLRDLASGRPPTGPLCPCSPHGRFSKRFAAVSVCLGVYVSMCVYTRLCIGSCVCGGVCVRTGCVRRLCRRAVSGALLREP